MMPTAYSSGTPATVTSSDQGRRSVNEKDWDDLAVQVVGRLKARIDPKCVPGIDSEIAGGEFAMAPEDITGILADDQVPVAEQDRRDLRALASEMSELSEDINRLLIEG